MGDNVRTVIIAGDEGDPASVTAAGSVQVLPDSHVSDTISTTTFITTASGTNQQILAAQGSGVTTVLVGLVVTTDTATEIRIHWGDGTTNDVLRFDYIAAGGVAYNYGIYGLKSSTTNEALKVDVAAVADVTYTIYYYTE